MSRVYYDSRGRKRGVSYSGREQSFLAAGKCLIVLLFVAWPYTIPSNDGLNIALGVMWDVLVVAPVVAVIVYVKRRKSRRHR